MFFFIKRCIVFTGDILNLNISENKKEFILALLIPLSLGLLSFLLTRNGIANYSDLVKPSFAPPNFLFSIVWTILYTLMGISSYIIYSSMDYHKCNCLLLYGINLFKTTYTLIISQHCRF